jgi:hypothetical protein
MARARRTLAALVATLFAALPAAAAPARTQALPPLPSGWPKTLQLGSADGPGGARDLKRRAPFGFRYQYLAGGVNTGQGWERWNEGGKFVDYYVQESAEAGIRPVFTYYMIRQSLPGRDDADERRAVLTNLRDAGTMAAYLGNLELFFQRAAGFPGTSIVLHVEPDLWGYGQQVAQRDDAASVPVAPPLGSLAGLAQEIVRLRDRLAPNVLLGYHMSVWGTGEDIQYSDPPNERVDELAARAAAFYRSLGARFDLAFGEFSDRDAAFKQFHYGDGGASWWKPADFARHVRFVRGFTVGAGLRMALWQIPLGNTLMRAQDNTWWHYQDNRVQWLLGAGSPTHLRAYVAAGGIAFLFGGGAAGTTCACDAAGDGVTNPPPINGNKRKSLNADDDGGYFLERARAYYRRGAPPL